MDVSSIKLEAIVQEVLNRISANQEVNKGCNNIISYSASGDRGIFKYIEDAIEAAYIAQQALANMSLDKRRGIINAMREAALANVNEIARLAVSETGIGRFEDKINKNILAAEKTPGPEEIEPKTYTGDNGFTLVERAPYGVIGAITPSTNPSETIICNSIGMISAGNSVVFNAHPGAKKVTEYTIRLLNEAIVKAGGPENLLCGVAEPNMQTSNVLMSHPKIRILVVTGGPEIVKIAMNSGKKAIAAGPGNPPVVVDETANIDKAAKAIVEGAAFDNNVLCIAEKEVFVVEPVADALINNMIKEGAYKLSKTQLEELMKHISTTNKNGEIAANKRYVGKDIQFILETIGLKVDKSIKLAIAEVAKDHPLVFMEQLMPVLPVVRVKNVDEAISEAYKAEQNNFHTAVMHSMNIENLSKMARKMNTSIFVKNAPSYAGLGMLGEGYATFTIASPTGEGLTSPMSFTRQRRCVLKDQLRII